VSPVTLGTMNFGDASWGADDQTSTAIIDAYLEAGGNSLDTANGYNGGRSEDVIGPISASTAGCATVLSSPPSSRATCFSVTPMGRGSPESGQTAGGGFVRRLRTDYIDLYWQHNWDRHTPLEETMSVLDDLVRQGTVRYVGLSDTHAWAVARSATIAQSRAGRRLALSRSSTRSLPGQWRASCSARRTSSAWCDAVGSAGQRRAVGEVHLGEPGAGRSGRAGFAAPLLADERTFKLLDALGALSAELGVRVAAIALASVRQRPGVTSTIVGARTAAQLAANLASVQVQLSDETMAKLDELTTLALNFPAEFLVQAAIPWQQGGMAINGVRTSSTFPIAVRGSGSRPPIRDGSGNARCPGWRSR
jgi:aryl-alcohol dehydrogenase-like predicted oxidoreductase